jgi:glycosyltransferase involved in cell wall biosynthesis
MSKVSVIIPTHSRPDLLPRAVESAHAAGTDVEVIVVDDASVDRTSEVCGELSGIKYVRVDRNQGVAGARNVGLMHAEGEYIAFLDDDDLRLPGSLDLQAQNLDAHPESGFVCGGMVMADQNYRPTGEIVWPKISGDIFFSLMELDFPIMGLAVLVRKECFVRVGLFHRKVDGIDDWDMFLRIAELYSVLVDPEPVGIYRQPTVRSGQGSSARAAQLLRLAKHQKKLMKLPRVAELAWWQRQGIRYRTKNRIADHLLWSALQLLPKREFGPAYANLLVALRLAPWRPWQLRGYKRLVKRLSARAPTIVNLEKEARLSEGP